MAAPDGHGGLFPGVVVRCGEGDSCLGPVVRVGYPAAVGCRGVVRLVVRAGPPALRKTAGQSVTGQLGDDRSEHRGDVGADHEVGEAALLASSQDLLDSSFRVVGKDRQ